MAKSIELALDALSPVCAIADCPAPRCPHDDHLCAPHTAAWRAYSAQFPLAWKPTWILNGAPKPGDLPAPERRSGDYNSALRRLYDRCISAPDAGAAARALRDLLTFLEATL